MRSGPLEMLPEFPLVQSARTRAGAAVQTGWSFGAAAHYRGRAILVPLRKCGSNRRAGDRLPSWRREGLRPRFGFRGV